MSATIVKSVPGVGRVVNREGTVQVTDDCVKWSPLKSGLFSKKTAEDCSLPLVDLIAVSKDDNQNSCLVVHHVKRKLELSVLKTAFDCTDPETRDNLYEKLHQKISELTGCPKKLLVFVNPESGSRKGVKVYETKVAPLFALAGIETEVVITTRAKEATEILTSYNLSSVNGVVAVGGDGMFSECANGLLNNAVREDGGNFKSPPDVLPVTSVPLGFIPCGTGNAMSYLSWSEDVVTAVLYTILGHRTELDIASVHQGDMFISYSSVAIGSGCMSDSFQFTESNRQMGKNRYFYGMGKAFINARAIPAEVQVLRMTNETSRKMDGTGTAMVTNQTQATTGDGDVLAASSLNKSTNSTWETVKGEVISLVMVPNGVEDEELESHGLGTFGVQMKTSFPRIGMIKFFNALFNGQKTETEHVKFFTDVTELKFRVDTDEGYEPVSLDWFVSIDGEATQLPNTDIPPSYWVRLHQGKIKVFSCF